MCRRQLDAEPRDLQLTTCDLTNSVPSAAAEGTEFIGTDHRGSPWLIRELPRPNGVARFAMESFRLRHAIYVRGTSCLSRLARFWSAVCMGREPVHDRAAGAGLIPARE